MKVFLIKLGCVNYGICVSESIEKVKNYYNHNVISYDIIDITNEYDFPALEVKVTNELKRMVV
jgi:hypothetical protein